MNSNRQHEPPPPVGRRNFFKEAAALIISAVTTLVPAVAGFSVLLDPVRRKSEAVRFLKVARLQDLEEVGVPQRFPVIATKTDVWNKIPEAKIGAIYLMRTGPNPADLVAFNVSCPHLGCAVEYRVEETPPLPEENSRRSGFYFCPCHNSSFALDGAISDPNSPSKRPLDSLKVKLEGQDVLVEFQNFEADKAQKIPVS